MASFMEDFSHEKIFARHAAAAGVAVATEVALTCPLDVLKTLLQVCIHKWISLHLLLEFDRCLDCQDYIVDLGG